MTAVLSATLKRAILRNLFLSIWINLANYVFISLFIQLIGGMISYGRQCL